MAFPGAPLRWVCALALLHSALGSSVAAALAIDVVYSPLSFARRALGLGRRGVAASCATELRLIVSGLSGTGTRSIKQALGSVGYRCYHTDDLVSLGHLGLDLWGVRASPSAAGGGAAEADSALRAAVDEVLSSGYDCVVDAAWPHAAGLARLYPSALVLHSERDSAEDWFRSSFALNAAFAPAYGRPLRWLVDLRRHDVPLRTLGGLASAGNITWRHPLPWVDLPAVATAEQFQRDRATYVAAYDGQRMRVESAARGRLLVFDVKQGWPPLCEFLSLGSSCPEGPFPHVRRGLDLNFTRLLLEFACYAYPILLPFFAFTMCAFLFFTFVASLGACLFLRMLTKDFVLRPLFRARREKLEAAQARAHITARSDQQPKPVSTPKIKGEELDKPWTEERRKDSQVMKRVLDKLREESLREREEAQRIQDGYVDRLPAHREDEDESEPASEDEDEDEGVDVD